MKLPSALSMMVFCLTALASVGSSAAPIDDFFGFIQNKKIDSSRALFAALSTEPAYRELLENPVLAPSSFALHRDKVSAEFPRIILHHDTLTIMTNGDPRDKSSSIFEIITFDPSTKVYQFSLVNFAARDPALKFIRDASQTDFVALEKADSAFEGLRKCSTCHAMHGATELRPRWGLAPIYQVPFGSADDKIHAGSRQLAAWQTFAKTLNDPETGALYRYLKIETKTEKDGSIQFPRRPNAAMTEGLESKNRERVARILKSSPRYGELRYALVAALLGDTDAISFLSPSARRDQDLRFKTTLNPRLPERALLEVSTDELPSAILRNTQEQNRQSLDVILQRVDAKNGQVIPFDLTGMKYAGVDLATVTAMQIEDLFETSELETAQKISTIRYLFEDSVSEKPIFWSTHLPFAFGDSYRFSKDFLNSLLTLELGPELLRDHPELNDFKNGAVSAANLLIPAPAYFVKLKTMSSRKNAD